MMSLATSDKWPYVRLRPKTLDRMSPFVESLKFQPRERSYIVCWRTSWSAPLLNAHSNPGDGLMLKVDQTSTEKQVPPTELNNGT